VWKTPPLWAPVDSDSVPDGFTAADAVKISSLGLDGFRLAYFWEGLEPSPGTIDDSYLNRIAGVEADLASQGIFVVLDSHQDMYSSYVFHGDGFPAWTIHDDGLPLVVNLGFPANYFTPAVSRAFDNFWNDDDGVLRAYAQQLHVVASRFATDPMVVGYDLLNEPWPGTQWPSCAQPPGCPVFDSIWLEPAEDLFAGAVRSVDKDHVVFYEPNFFFDGGADTGLGPVPATLGPIGLSFHNECVSRALAQVVYPTPLGPELEGPLTILGNAVCPVGSALVFAHALRAAARMNAVPLMTEVAPTTDSDMAGLECLLEGADEAMVGWTYGLSWDSGELEHLGLEKAAVLSRAYPLAVAGSPLEYEFDPRNGLFTLRYRSDPRIAAPTVVFLPLPLAYPDGYRVAVQGARVVSAPGAALLELANQPGVTVVSVQVAPVPGTPPGPAAELPSCSEVPPQGTP
jgi:endoglycosylceramidase